MTECPGLTPIISSRLSEAKVLARFEKQLIFNTKLKHNLSDLIGRPQDTSKMNKGGVLSVYVVKFQPFYKKCVD